MLSASAALFGMRKRRGDAMHIFGVYFFDVKNKY